jgi:hypothetical protein
VSITLTHIVMVTVLRRSMMPLPPVAHHLPGDLAGGDDACCCQMPITRGFQKFRNMVAPWTVIALQHNPNFCG